MKPLHILHTEPSSDLGGEELRILSEASGMVRRGHAVTLAVPLDSRLKRYAEQRGLLVVPLSMNKSRYLPLVFEFLHLFRRYQTDVVNTHGSVDSWSASIGARLSRRKPVIVRTRHISIPVRRGLRHRLLYRRLPHAVVTTGEALRVELMQTLGIAASRIVSIPSGVDLGVFQPSSGFGPLRSELGLAPDQIVVGTVAFMRRYKALDNFLLVAQIVLQQRPDVRFLVVGDGPQHPKIAQMVHDLKLTDRVLLTGFREDVPQLMALMDIFVLSSVRGEGLPQALTQAMAMERPVVATMVGSVPEVVRHDVTGFLTVPGDHHSLAGYVLKLIHEPATRIRLARAGRDLIEKEYDLEHMLDLTEALYADLLRRESR